MSVLDAVHRRGVTELLHFTTDKGIIGTIAGKALKSRQRVQDDPDLAFIFQSVWPRRDEAWLDHVSLSISRINRSLYAKATRNLPERWWGILAFRPEILGHGGLVFTTTNNVYEEVCERGTGEEAFEALFKPRVPWGYQGSVHVRRDETEACLPTDPQAEVLYPGEIPIEHLACIYVAEPHQRALIAAWCDALQRPEPPVEVRSDLFL